MMVLKMLYRFFRILEETDILNSNSKNNDTSNKINDDMNIKFYETLFIDYSGINFLVIDQFNNNKHNNKYNTAGILLKKLCDICKRFIERSLISNNYSNTSSFKQKSNNNPYSLSSKTNINKKIYIPDHIILSVYFFAKFTSNLKALAVMLVFFFSVYLII
jgi:hypothetical protein